MNISSCKICISIAKKFIVYWPVYYKIKMKQSVIHENNLQLKLRKKLNLLLKTKIVVSHSKTKNTTKNSLPCPLMYLF